MKTVIIVQARMTSTRLPGKVLKRVLNKTLLEYMVERLRRVTRAAGLVIATTLNVSDDPIVALCDSIGVSSFRGSEDDVLSRYHGAALHAGADVVVRVTSDCPLIDPAVIDGIIAAFHDRMPDVNYISNVLIRSFPRGMDTEVFSFEALDQAFIEATEAAQREHVTPFINRQPARFRIEHITHHPDLSRHRWTVDTPEDFELIERMLTALYQTRPEFDMNDCLALLDAHPDWSSLNAHVEQKQYGQ